MAEAAIDPSRLAGLLVESRVAVIAIDPDANVTSWSQGATDLFGWTADEMIGRPLATVWPDETRAADVRLLEGVTRGEHPHFQAWRRRKNGSHFLAEISTSPITEAGEHTGTLALCRDVTAAAAGAADLHRLLGASSLAIVGIDEQRNIRSWGGAAESMYGWTADEVLGLPVTILWANDQTAVHTDAVSSAKLGESSIFRAWRRRKDGSRFLAELTVSPTTKADGWVGSVSVSRDVTREHAMSKRLADAERRFAAAFTSAALPLVICELDGHVVEANAAYRAVALGVDPRADTRVLDLIAPHDRPVISAALRSLAKDHQRFEGAEVAAVGDSGRILRISIAPVDEGPDAHPLALVQIADVSDYRRIQGELAATASIDHLTRTFNRSFFGPLLDSMQDDRALAVLFVDIDSFKAVNDSIGHRGGDRVLQAIADRLVEVLTEQNFVIRFGGDEFVLVCPDIDDERAATLLADHIRRVVSEPIDVGDRTVTVTASIGAALVTTGPDLTADAAVGAADSAMYAAKAAGRDTTAFAPLP